jgi:multidrug resistance efflux pump
MRLRGKLSLGIVFILLVSVAVMAAPAFLSKLWKTSTTDIPTVRVTRGSLETKIYALGELRPSSTAMMIAPPVGGTLQIIHAVNTGTFVEKGDVVVEFDPVEQEYNLEINRSQLEEAEQQIKKMQADIAVRKAQDNVSLLSAGFNVRRAELRVKENELLGTIEARKNVISLEEAKRRLEQMGRDVKSKASSDQADLTLQNVNRSRAMMQMKLAQQNIDNMKLRAPISGVVVMSQSSSMMMVSSGGVIITDSTEYREGDQAYPGMTIAQIQDVQRMEIASKVAETDRSNLNPGQAIDVRVDSLPSASFTGKVKSLAGMASTSTQTASDYYAGIRSFDAVFELDSKGIRINPGVSTRIEIRGTNLDDALSLPRQALFAKEGKSIVYVRRPPEDWAASTVQVKYLTESRAVIEGLAEGTEVALIDPTLQKSKSGRKSGSLTSILGGAAQ